MTNTSVDVFNELCIIAKLVNTTMKVECIAIDLRQEKMIEFPQQHLSTCLCQRLSAITGKPNDIKHLYKRCQDAAEIRMHLMYTCPFDLTNIIFPVIQDNQIIAALQVGPILTIEPDELLQKHALPLKTLDIKNLQSLREYLLSLPSGDMDYANALAEIITILVTDRPLHLITHDFKIQGIKNRNQDAVSSTFFETALGLIAANFTNDDISLDSVAKSVYVHPAHLSRVFSQAFNCNFRSYINSLRINLAGELLLETDESIGAICLEVGFSDQSYFDKIFKKIQGVTPSQYRKIHQNSLENTQMEALDRD